VHHQHLINIGYHRNRREIPFGIKRQAFEQGGMRRQYGVEREEKRVAIRSGLGDRLRSQVAIGSCPILDHERLLEAAGQRTVLLYCPEQRGWQTGEWCDGDGSRRLTLRLSWSPRIGLRCRRSRANEQ
jgi:hypothetical protein